jgi:hypothetical protein
MALRRGARPKRLDNDDLFVYVRHPGSAWRFECGRYLDPSGWRRTREPPLPAADRAFLVPSAPLVSAIMPTADRRPMVARAIAYFLRQNHRARELVVLDDGHDRVKDLIRTTRASGTRKAGG